MVDLLASVSGGMDARRGSRLSARVAWLEAVIDARSADGNRLDELAAENARLKLRVAVVEARLSAAERALAVRNGVPDSVSSNGRRGRGRGTGTSTLEEGEIVEDVEEVEDVLSPHLGNLLLAEPEDAPTPPARSAPGSAVTTASGQASTSPTSPEGGGLRARLARAITQLDVDKEPGPEIPPGDGEARWTVRYFDAVKTPWTEDADAAAERKAKRTVEDERSAYSPLTRSAMARLRHTANAADARKVLVNVGGCRIRGEDLALLTPGTWVNDEIINAYLQLLMRRAGRNGLKIRAVSSFFYAKLVERDARTGEFVYDYGRVRRWMRRLDVFALDLILVPINTANTHWTLGVINVKERRVEHYDSMGGAGSEIILGHLLRWVWDEREGRKLEVEEWGQVAMGSRVPQQNNADDCGVFVCKYADFLARGTEMTFAALHINYFRARIAHELLMERAA